MAKKQFITKPERRAEARSRRDDPPAEDLALGDLVVYAGPYGSTGTKVTARMTVIEIDRRNPDRIYCQYLGERKWFARGHLRKALPLWPPAADDK